MIDVIGVSMMDTGMETLLTLAWVPFVDPLPLWDVWYLLFFPLALGVAIVNKTMKCATPGEIPAAATVLALWIVGAFVGGALGLYALVALLT